MRGYRGLAWWAIAIGCALIVRPLSAQTPHAPHKIGVWDSAPRTACYGVLGEVAKPGTYVSNSGQDSVQELVQQAGGLTPQASPAIRVIRQARIAQTLLFSPTGHDTLQPGDIIVIDAASAARSPASVIWLALIGVADRPVIVPVRPEFASINRITVEMLGQSQELTSQVRVLAPPRTSVASAASALPSGTALIFDHGLLVEQTLPSFPEAVPFRTIEEKRPTDGNPWASADAVPPPPARDRVLATPVPFSAMSDERTLTTPASMPAPGSRFYVPPPLPTTAPSAHIQIPPVDPKLAADESIEILPAPAPPELDAPSVQRHSVSPLQLLGISGTVACLIGIAIATRKYLDSSEAAPVRTALERVATPIPELARIDAPHSQPAPPIVATPNVMPTQSKPDDLNELLSGKLSIVTEPIQFPTRFPLQRRADCIPTVFRLDDRQTDLPAPHNRRGEPQHEAVAIDTPTSGVPRPHFASRASRVESREVDRGSAAEMPAPQIPISTQQSTVARALERLHGGRS